MNVTYKNERYDSINEIVTVLTNKLTVILSGKDNIYNCPEKKIKDFLNDNMITNREEPLSIVFYSLTSLEDTNQLPLATTVHHDGRLKLLNITNDNILKLFKKLNPDVNINNDNKPVEKMSSEELLELPVKSQSSTIDSISDVPTMELAINLVNQKILTSDQETIKKGIDKYLTKKGISYLVSALSTSNNNTSLKEFAQQLTKVIHDKVPKNLVIVSGLSSLLFYLQKNY